MNRTADTGAGIWIIDPIDGTSNFLRARPEWCVSIGFVDAGDPAIGAICHLPSGDMYAAHRGGGAWPPPDLV